MVYPNDTHDLLIITIYHRGLHHITGVLVGTEIILSDNLEFGQRAQAAGAPVQVEVFSSMWHDFVQESDGCGAIFCSLSNIFPFLHHARFFSY